MNASKFFLDTNIIVYTFDITAPEKQNIAQGLLESALNNGGIISYQVIQEFMNLALRKFQPVMTHKQAQDYLREVLLIICDFYPTDDFYTRSLDIHNRWRFGWYDTLIIGAALESGCDVLYSEDLQHGQKVEELSICNPFV